MTRSFHVITLLMVSVAMALSLAHALELPGKLRLGKEAYMAMQPIYYPGFTIGGLIGEFGGMLGLLVLLFLYRAGGGPFWWILAALLFSVASHATYWLITHPVNNFWLKDVDVRGLAKTFFSTFSANAGNADWTRLRDIWEYSHVARAVLASLSLVAVTVALAL